MHKEKCIWRVFYMVLHAYSQLQLLAIKHIETYCEQVDGSRHWSIMFFSFRTPVIALFNKLQFQKENGYFIQKRRSVYTVVCTRLISGL